MAVVESGVVAPDGVGISRVEHVEDCFGGEGEASEPRFGGQEGTGFGEEEKLGTVSEDGCCSVGAALPGCFASVCT